MEEPSEDTDFADIRPRPRLGVIVVVALLHVAAILALIRAFAPDFTAQVTRTIVSTFNVTVTTPPPSPPPPPPKAPDKAGREGLEGKKAKPKEVKAPEPKIAISRQTAPKVASTGNANTSGARDAGAGTGAGGAGSGTGAGGSGDGSGGGAATKAVKIAGEINSARDYPRETRDLRIDDYVVVALTVGADGRVKGCRVHRSSKDPQADQITCRLATDRFRFKPATDAAGNPVQSTYGWQQRWFYNKKD